MEDIDALFDTIDRDFGKLDILINCGAASPYFGPIADTQVAAFDKDRRGEFARAVLYERQSGSPNERKRRRRYFECGLD